MVVSICVVVIPYNADSGVCFRKKRMGDIRFGMGRWGQDGHKKGRKSGPKIVFSGAPGRGVLRFLAGGYRRPVHFLPKNAIFSLFCQT